MTTTLRQRFFMHMRLVRGGSCLCYHILDGDKIVGSKTTEVALIAWNERQTRKLPITTTYTLGDRAFETAKEFIAAYEQEKKDG